jgi:hypothetical protein
MEDLDRLTTRISLSAFVGAIAGVGTSLFKGFPMRRTVGLTALSCAMTGTACFGAERCATIVSRRLWGHLGNEWDTVLTSHFIGGVVGGSLLGGLYIGKPVHGVVFFVPLMLLVGTGEKLFQDMREEHLQRVALETSKVKRD